MTIAKFINEVGFKVREGDVKKVNGTISNIKNTAAKLLGAIGIGFSLTQINVLVEEFGRVNEQVKNSTAALGDQAEIQKKIMESARQTRSSYAETAGVISDLVHESPELFGNIDEAVKFNNAATMLFKSAGKTNEDIAGLMEAINKSFAKGYVDSETISQLLERSPEAVELLNKKLGTTSDKLEEMASSRTMTVADLKAAFVDNASIIEQKFGGVQYRITDALTVVRSEWGLWLTQMDSTLGVTNTIANAMVKFSDTAMRVMNRVRNAVQWLSDKLGGSEKLLKLLTITVGAFLIASKADKVIGFLKNAGSLLGKLKTGLGAINLKVVAIAAAIIILALLIEDFVNFMQGNDSLLGSMLEKAGIDADKVRETIQNAFQKVKDFLITTWGVIKTVLTTVWNVLKTVATSVFGGLQRFWEKHGEQIMTALANIWTGIKDRLILVWNIIKTVAMVVFGALKKFWDTWGESILTAFEAVWNVIKAVFGTAFNVLADLFAGILRTVCRRLGGLLGEHQAVFCRPLERHPEHSRHHPNRHLERRQQRVVEDLGDRFQHRDRHLGVCDNRVHEYVERHHDDRRQHQAVHRGRLHRCYRLDQESTCPGVTVGRRHYQQHCRGNQGSGRARSARLCLALPARSRASSVSPNRTKAR